MFNPLDPAEILIAAEGDASVAPGYPRGGVLGSEPFLEYRSDPRALPPMFRVFSFTLASGQTIVCDADDRPDFWLAATTDTPTTETAFYNGPGDGDVPLRLGPKGHATILATGNQLSVRSLLGTAKVNVVAVRGCPWASLSWGG